MPTYALRNFLYLDQQAVDDYLAGMQGALYEEKVTEAKESSKSVGGEGGISVLKGSGKLDSKESTAVEKRMELTPAAKFQRLYSLLEEAKGIRYYETMDAESWLEIRRNDLLELGVSITFSKLSEMTAASSQMEKLMAIYKDVTGHTLVDSQSQAAIDGINALGKLESEKGIPTIFALRGNPEFRFVGYLDASLLRVPKERMTGEVTIFCKVQRRIEKGEKIELFDLISAVEILATNRAQKRKIKKTKPPEFLQQVIRGPAAQVIPIAIYR
ncbi:MAG: hypothetical protein B6D41_16030 [Chloroflexi bacterium UTCFX4]|jgi:hypothetical protein|nr:MAG: hypothetical protein B6D41_16030 [Chloroflexi bacterium UTCFX4]